MAGILEKTATGILSIVAVFTTTSGALETTLALGHRRATLIAAYHCCRQLKQSVAHLSLTYLTVDGFDYSDPTPVGGELKD